MPAGWSSQLSADAGGQQLVQPVEDGGRCGAHKSSLPGSAGGGDVHHGGQKFQ